MPPVKSADPIFETALGRGPNRGSRAAALAVRETACCSFFTFHLSISDGAVVLTVGTGPEHTDVLAALGERVQALLAAVAR